MSLSPILFSGLKENTRRKQHPSLLEDASGVIQRGKGIHTPLKLAKEFFAWANWLPFDHPFRSWVTGGKAVIKLCRPPNRPLKLFTKVIGLSKKGAGLSSSAVILGKDVLKNGWDRSQWRKVYRVVKDFFFWTLKMANLTCKVVLLASNEFLKSITSQLPNLLFNMGMLTSAPLIGVSLITQFKERLERSQVVEPTSPILQDVHRSATKVMSLGLLSTLFKTVSFCLTGFGLLSTLAVPVLIPLSLSTAGISSSVAALYERKKFIGQENYVRPAV